MFPLASQVKHVGKINLVNTFFKLADLLKYFSNEIVFDADDPEELKSTASVVKSTALKKRGKYFFPAYSTRKYLWISRFVQHPIFIGHLL